MTESAPDEAVEVATTRLPSTRIYREATLARVNHRAIC